MLATRLLLALTLWAVPTGAQHLLEPPLQPASYSSPSTEYELHVDPTSRHGEGPGRYRMTLKGEELWSAEHPFTFQEAVVADDGSCAGYACSDGPRGLGELVVAILGPTGKVRAVESKKRRASRYPHGAPNPRVHGLVHQVDADLLVVLVPDPDSSRANETWWTYRMSTGLRLGALEPKLRMDDPEYARWSMSAEAVPGTELVLSHWLCQGKPFKRGGRFCLTDPTGNSVWQVDLGPEGAILGVGPGQRFELRFAKAGERVTFEVGQGPDGWLVTETRRSPYELVKPAAAPAVAIQDIELEELGRVHFGTRALDDSPVRGVVAYDVDDRGRIGAVRRPPGGEGDFSFVRFDPGGNAEPAFDLPEFPSDPWPGIDLCWIEGDRWLITRWIYESRTSTDAFWLDADTGTLRSIEEWRSPEVDRLARGPDGRLFALVTYSGAGTRMSSLLGRDARGGRLWEIGERYEDPTKLFSPMDVAVTTDGQVIVLGGILDELRIFSSEGKWLRTVDLRATLGKEPEYPTEIHALPDGGLLVKDQNRYAVLDEDFALVRWFQPHYVDGSTTGIGPLVVDARGRWWSRDEGAFLELDEEGTVRRFIGPEPDPDALTEIEAVTIDPAGRIYLLDSRIGAVHVYDRDGELLRICQPAQGDWGERVTAWWMSVRADGSLFVDGDYGGFILEFAPDGSRRERHEAEGRYGDWAFVPGRSEHWSHYVEEIELIDEDGSLIRRLERTADGEWFEYPSALGVAPDGSVAVVDDARSMLHLFAPDGEPRGSARLPQVDGEHYGVAFDGSQALVIGDANELLLVSTDGTPVRRHSTGLRSIEGFFFSPDGSEIWVVPYGKAEMIRYALPER